MIFVHECPWCDKRLTARTRLVLDAQVDEHTLPCLAAFRLKVAAAKRGERLEHVQLDLFGGKS